ncbi:MAG TPA: DUF3891 family protein [Pirellulales bacterium]|nr:DUF3891 family protein [Pirellulales bacterium]
MIRRSVGTQRWTLISQVEHARLSGALAEAWDEDRFAGLPRDELVAAIAHHDDGWSAWEVSPKVDPKSGRPLDFTETPLPDSLAIWRESIARAEQFGPLAAYMVSGHFSALLERFNSRWKSDSTLERLAQGFLQEQRSDRERFLDKWRHHDNQEEGQVAAERAVAWLQTFDALSLWLCCAERSEAETFHPPDTESVTFSPNGGPYALEVSPWPFGGQSLEVEAVGRSIIAQRYANSSDLVTSPAEPVTLRWSLRPATACMT